MVNRTICRASNPVAALNAYTSLMPAGKARGKLGNPRSLPAYSSDIPFELVSYDRLIPPTYDVENEQYAADIAASMQTSGWTGRPLWGMELPDGMLDMRTGSHRWFALGLLLDKGEWPANLPFGEVPVYVMRKQDVPGKVWRAWEAADFWEMKDLGDEGIGPDPVVKLMRAERNPADLHRSTPRAVYELWNTTAKKNILVGKFHFMQDVNAAKKLYWSKHPMATLELRERRENPKSKHTPRLTEYAEKSLKGRLTGTGKALLDTVFQTPSDLAQVLAGEAGKAARKLNLTDRALRYRANQTPPAGPRRCMFCGTTRDVMVGHLDGHEENTSRENLIWNCRSCNAHLSNAYKKLGIGRRTRQYNPAVTWQQYGLAAAAMRGETSQMTPEQGAEMIRETPAADRSKFMREIWRESARRRAMAARQQEIPF
jgi:hypothetical protein